MKNFNNVLRNIETLNDFEINDCLIDNNYLKIEKNFFTFIPMKEKLESWIKFRIIYMSYILIVCGIITLSLCASFIGFYVCKNKIIGFNLLIAFIVFAILFFIGYFVMLFAYYFLMRKYFKQLKAKFYYLQKEKIITSDWKKIPDLLTMMNYDNEPITWQEQNHKFNKFSYFAINMALINFFIKLKEMIDTNG